MFISAPWNHHPIVPLVVFHSADNVEPVIDALLEGGIGIIEIGLRTDVSFEALIRAVGLGTIVVGAGTVNSVDKLNYAIDCGASFGVSPGTSPRLLDAVSGGDLPFIPGASTPTEVAMLGERGFTDVKLYPFSLLGGRQYLGAISEVSEAIRFMPSGGITAPLARELLADSAVFSVSGSWVAPSKDIAQKDFGAITQRAKEVRH